MNHSKSLISSIDIGRRGFLKLGAVAGLVYLNPALVNTSQAKILAHERSLSFFNTHTDEVVKATYWAQGNFIPQGLDEINRILRDFRTNQVAQIDTGLLDLLSQLNALLDTKQPFHIISGYRSPATNASLSQHGGGVAKKSMHLLGKAIDIRVPGKELITLRKAATSLKGGGVGYYPSSNFVHVDTGRVRYW